MSAEVVYEDGTEVPSSVTKHLMTINVGHRLVLIYKDGHQFSGIVQLSNNDLSWLVGDRPLMSAKYQPFQITFRDKEILTVVNLADHAEVNF